MLSKWCPWKVNGQEMIDNRNSEKKKKRKLNILIVTLGSMATVLKEAF